MRFLEPVTQLTITHLGRIEGIEGKFFRLFLEQFINTNADVERRDFQ